MSTTRRLAALASLLGVTGLLAFAEQPVSRESSIRKQRTHDVPTPGVLRPVRRETAVMPSFEPANGTLPSFEAWGRDSVTGAYYRRGELLVRFREGTSETLRVQALQRNRATRIPRHLPSNWELVAIDPNLELAEAAAPFALNAAVESVSPNFRVSTQQFRPNDEGYRLQWNFDAISLPYAWQINAGGRNDVVVAVVDSGLNTVSDTFLFSNPFGGTVPVRFSIVPDLVADGRITSAYDFVYRDEFPVDLGGHGTHVAGTIAQQTNNNIGVAGVAFNVKLMPLKVISGGSFISWDDLFEPANDAGSAAVVAEAIRYAADNGAKVVNLSLGTTGPIPTVRDAIQYAVDKGAFVAIAAGNDAELGNPTEYPAAYASSIDGAMTVGAVARNLRRAPYSGFQPYVEICAPGGDTQNDVDYERGVTQVGYEELSTLSFLSLFQKLSALQQGFRPRFDRFELRAFSGTSMATPHVSGVAALLYSQGVRNPAAIEQAIERFAAPLDATADECGAGLVDARRTLRGLGLSR